MNGLLHPRFVFPEAAAMAGSRAGSAQALGGCAAALTKGVAGDDLSLHATVPSLAVPASYLDPVILVVAGRRRPLSAALVNTFAFGQANTRHSSHAPLQEKLKREVPGGKMAGCCVFLRWPSTLPSLRSLDDSKVASLSSPAVTVVVEKEW
uniref:Uncharacterized protein n=1 Tax=Oryza barthii TaxID=65489 RepID=A0A0D3EKN4_9ORYZ